MHGVLSVPALLLIAWGIAGLLWWDRRRDVIAPRLVAWTLAALVLVAVAMLLMIASLPAPPLEQIVRAGLLIESVYGFFSLSRRKTGGADRGR